MKHLVFTKNQSLFEDIFGKDKVSRIMEASIPSIPVTSVYGIWYYAGYSNVTGNFHYGLKELWD